MREVKNSKMITTFSHALPIQHVVFLGQASYVPWSLMQVASDQA